MDDEPNDPARALIHDHRDAVGPQGFVLLNVVDFKGIRSR
jgi:hypothetical protein